MTKYPNRIPFDYIKALQGYEIVTRDDRKVKAIYYFEEDKIYPITAKIENEDGDFDTETYTLNGFFIEDSEKNNTIGSYEDLFLLPKTKTFWVNLYEDGSATWYESNHNALLHCLPSKTYRLIGTYPIDIEVK